MPADQGNVSDDGVEGDPVDDDDPMPEVEPSPSGSQTRKKAGVIPYCSTIQPKLRNLLAALYKQLPGLHGSGQFQNPIMRYLVLAGLKVKGKGEWRPSGNISQDVSALLFIGRLTMFSVMNEGLLVNDQYSYHE